MCQKCLRCGKHVAIASPAHDQIDKAYFMSKKSQVPYKTFQDMLFVATTLWINGEHVGKT